MSIESTEYLEYVDASTFRVPILPVEDYKVAEPWQMIWEVRDPEEPGVYLVELNEGGHGATPTSARSATQFDFPAAVQAGIMKAREINETQGFDRDYLFIVNAARTALARVVLPKEEVKPYYSLSNPALGPVFTD